MEIVDRFCINPTSIIYTIELEENRYVDVKYYKSDWGYWGCYVMENEDGTLVYDDKRNTYKNYSVNEIEITKFVAEKEKEYAES